MVDRAFKDLKQALTSPPVLALQECDACGVGLGAILSQNNHPIASERFNSTRSSSHSFNLQKRDTLNPLASKDYGL